MDNRYITAIKQLHVTIEIDIETTVKFRELTIKRFTVSELSLAR